MNATVAIATYERTGHAARVRLPPSIFAVVVSSTLGWGCGTDSPSTSGGGTTSAPPEIGTVEAFAELTGSSEGLAFGPGPDGSTVLYVGSRDGKIVRVAADGSVSNVVALPHPVGLASSADGTLLACGSTDESDNAPTVIWRITKEGEKSVLVDGGAEPFQQTNFVAVAPDGSILFTDSKANRIYRADGDGTHLQLVSDSVSFPNGIAFSKDGATAYVASWDAKKVMAFPSGADGTYGTPAVFSNDVPSVDGIATFASGDLLYIATGDGVLRYGQNGVKTTYAPAPAIGLPANGAFGVGAFGEGWVYITSLISKTLWRVYVGEAGAPLPAGSASAAP